MTPTKHPSKLEIGHWKHYETMCPIRPLDHVKFMILAVKQKIMYGGIVHNQQWLQNQYTQKFIYICSYFCVVWSSI
jgi:hypothetical protein